MQGSRRQAIGDERHPLVNAPSRPHTLAIEMLRCRGKLKARNGEGCAKSIDPNTPLFYPKKGAFDEEIPGFVHG
jgi:hypothetical protein